MRHGYITAELAEVVTRAFANVHPFILDDSAPLSTNTLPSW
jgi:hypothetical protein